MMMVGLLLLAQSLNPGVMPNEPSVVPMLLQPQAQHSLKALPGGKFAFEPPGDAREIGRDEASGVLALALPVGRQFCQLKLTTIPMPSGNAGSLALAQSARWKGIPGARPEAARRVAPGLLRHGVRFDVMNNPKMPRFILQWVRVEAGQGLLVELEAPGAFEYACVGRTRLAALSTRRIAP